MEVHHSKGSTITIGIVLLSFRYLKASHIQGAVSCMCLDIVMVTYLHFPNSAQYTQPQFLLLMWVMALTRKPKNMGILNSVFHFVSCAVACGFLPFIAAILAIHIDQHVFIILLTMCGIFQAFKYQFGIIKRLIL